MFLSGPWNLSSLGFATLSIITCNFYTHHTAGDGCCWIQYLEIEMEVVGNGDNILYQSFAGCVGKYFDIEEWV